MKKTLEKILIILLIIIIFLCGYLAFPELKDLFGAKQDVNQINELLNETDVESSDGLKDANDVESNDFLFTEEKWSALKSQNKDFIAYLKFDSGICSVPIVQGVDEDEYLRKSFFGKHSTQGTVFLDSRQTIDDQNLIIYGHNVFYDSKAMFSPLTKLINQQYYEDNSTFKMYFQNEVRSYQVVAAYYYDVEKDAEYNFQDFTPALDFRTWSSGIELRNTIKSKYTYSSNDDFVTFQTCKAWDDNVRIVIVAKECNAESY